MTVYIDSLFLINLFMDTVLIFITNLLLKKYIKTLKLVTGAALLAIYGCFMFFKEISFLYSVLFKLSITFITVLFVFGKNSFIKNTIVFWLVSAMCGGIIFALSIMTNFGRVMNASVSNLIVYLNINPVLLCIGCILLYVFAEVYRRLCIKNFSRDNFIIDVTFIYMGKEYSIRTLIDTGCSLTEPLSGAPLLVVSKKSVSDIITTGSKVSAKSVCGFAELDLILPEKIVCKDEKYKLCSETLIALSLNDIGEDGLYNAVINPVAVVENISGTVLCKERVEVNG